MNSLTLDLQAVQAGLQSAASSGTLGLLAFAILIACAFEFINGFHDTANAVATVIYTRSLRPWPAVVWSGICNFLGVFVGGTAVAMGIVKLLPVDLLATNSPVASLIMIFSLLIAACLWNLGTWYFGIPASSSHTLIGSVLGIGVGNALWQGLPMTAGVNWSKAGDVGLALLVSPMVGFTFAALGVLLLKRLVKNPVLHRAPPVGEKPPLPIRLALIGTSTGVSFAHGSNDGQKGVGLVMLVLISVLPAQFALNPTVSEKKIQEIREATSKISVKIASLPGSTSDSGSSSVIATAHAAEGGSANTGPHSKSIRKAGELAGQITSDLSQVARFSDLKEEGRFALRAKIFKLESELGKLEKAGVNLTEVKSARKALASLTEYAPFWVLAMVALALGVGTMVGWKRIVVTLGEKIGKAHLTYSQGAVSELVAMSTIGISALAGVPVSTTHCLSSGIAGSMVATGAGVRAGTVRNILLAWVLTLPVTLVLSAGLYLGLRSIFG